MYPFIMNDSSVTIIVDGKSHTISNSHVNYAPIKEALKAGDAEIVKRLIDVPKSINERSKGLVTIDNGIVYYKEREIHNSLTSRMVSMMSEGFSVEPLVKFLENVMLNPSYRAVNELYGFLEKNNLPITDHGTFLAYKKIRRDWKDVYTGTIDNSIGTVVEMERQQVDDNCNNTCSSGLHFCSLEYLPNYSGDPVSGESRVVIVEINPADVVSIPADYNNSKGRCCRYKVVDDVTTQTIDYLNKPYHSFANEGDDWSDDEDDYDDEDYDASSSRYDDDDDDDDDELTESEVERLDILENIQELVDELFNLDIQLTELSVPDDLGMDSLDVVELEMSIEEEFGVVFSEEVEAKIRNVGDLIDLIQAETSTVTVTPVQPAKASVMDDVYYDDDEYGDPDNC